MQTNDKIQQPSVLPIVGYGSPILRKVCSEVENKPIIQSIATDLLLTMRNIGTAVGLAAPQVNLELSMFVMKSSLYPDMVVINPTILKRRGGKPSEEGCLSIPGINGVVPERNEILDVQFFDQNFNKKKLRLRGFDAIVFQHEYDHLQGILYTDRMTKEGLELVQDKLSAIEQGKSLKTYYDMIFPGTDIKQIEREPIKEFTEPLFLSTTDPYVKAFNELTNGR